MIAFLLAILAMAPIHSGAFTLRKLISSHRIPFSTTNLGMAVQLDRSPVVDNEISVEEIRKSRYLNENELNGSSFEE
jgi:hypothetical protein